MNRLRSRMKARGGALPPLTLNDVRANRIGKWATREQAKEKAMEEYRSLCLAHKHQWDWAGEDAFTIARNTPSPITLTHIGTSLDHIDEGRVSACEEYLRHIDSYEQDALRACRAGYGCTITEPVQDALPGCAA